MNKYRSMIMIWTAVLTVVALALCLLFGGPYSSYFLFKLFYPFTMLIASQKHEITMLATVIGLIQFPLYGLILILMKSRIILRRTILVLAIIHFVTVILAVNLVEGFS